MKRHLTYITLICFLFIACSSSTFESSPGVESESESEAETETTGTVWNSIAEEDWEVKWTGYGSVDFEETGIVLEPMASTVLSETHSSLVTHIPTQENPISDFKVTIAVTNEEQLRTPIPNEWEVFWLFFNATFDENNAELTNYFILKTNGTQLAISDDVVGETFLYTGSEAFAFINTQHEIILEKIGQIVSVTIDGIFAFTYDGDEEAIPVLDQAGTIGLYTEDARVRIHSIEIEAY